jgi:hypothetical protein
MIAGELSLELARLRIHPKGHFESESITAVILVHLKTTAFQDATSRVKLLVSERHISGMYANKASMGDKNKNGADCLCFLNCLAYLRPAADRTDSALCWV